jgi:large subunit ribosomal protein L30
MKIKVTQIHSTIRHMECHKRVAKALGLGRIGKSRIHDDNKVVRGMIEKVKFLVKVENVADNATDGE